jgi:hypothetical protein
MIEQTISFNNKKISPHVGGIMKITSQLLVLLAIALFAFVLPSKAQIPPFISYQGVLTDTTGNPKPDGDYLMSFRLYDVPSGGTALWSELNKKIPVRRGLFSTRLGELSILIPAVQFDRPLWLGIQVGGNEELLPRIPLTTVGYSFHSVKAETAAVAMNAARDTTWYTSKANVYRLSGNVGIGTSAPLSKLTVVDDNSAEYGLRVEKIASGGNSQAVSGINTATPADGYASHGGFFQASSNAGLGNKFGVRGQALGTGNDNFGGYFAADGATNNYGVYAVSNSSTGFAGLFNGNVGIFVGNLGVGLPGIATERLQVGGVVHSTSGGFKFPDGSVQTTASTGGLTLPFSGTTASTSTAFSASNTGLGDALYGSTSSQGSVAVNGTSLATSGGGRGVFGQSNSTEGYGVSGLANATSGTNYGVYGQSTSPSGYGVYGLAPTKGVYGVATTTSGTSFGVVGLSSSSTGRGVHGQATSLSGSTTGVWGENSSTEGQGVLGYASSSTGNTIGVYGGSNSTTGTGIFGTALSTSGITYGVYGQSNSPSGYAGYFQGNVHVTGTLSKGGGSFKIDHPLDPANKYLYHSFVESPDMKNVYDGVVTLDRNGKAWVTLPEWFEALNKDFRYQLTAIGAPGPNLYIASEMQHNRFQIVGGSPGTKVSWQVTGIRKDAFAEKYRIPVEEEKKGNERGKYLHPDAFGFSKEMGIPSIQPPKLTEKVEVPRLPEPVKENRR